MKCERCNIDMTEGLGIRADEQVSIDNMYRLYVINNPNDYYGRRISEKEVKCRICPMCGKVELYIEPNYTKMV